MKDIVIRPARREDRTMLAELRAVVLRDDLTRLGRYDEERVRQRFYQSYDPEYTWIMETDDAEFVGCVALKPDADDGLLLEHFYIHPSHQGRGIGSWALTTLLSQSEVQGKRVSLNVLQGSPAQRLYERFGFKVDREDPVDVFMSLTLE
ncbi:GNAT family N-acetyltransferase [Cohnella sp. AR92]|uniref:GNAT family N-acetyltransferase n=1 Tax=Cohnella sp. AR92 TaxID=648716 RepID=UPI000F8DE604|nr:GNAT family N-acetyltransferase [Cohnella sp. AR92]RUS48945.1 N-acetyltransferase [Cohnella sp. AR92]